VSGPDGEQFDVHQDAAVALRMHASGVRLQPRRLCTLHQFTLPIGNGTLIIRRLRDVRITTYNKERPHERYASGASFQVSPRHARTNL
jgi:hypothetical protein